MVSRGPCQGGGSETGPRPQPALRDNTGARGNRGEGGSGAATVEILETGADPRVPLRSSAAFPTESWGDAGPQELRTAVSGQELLGARRPKKAARAQESRAPPAPPAPAQWCGVILSLVGTSSILLP